MRMVLILIIIALFLLWPQISRWLKRFMLRRAESYFRKAAGMPPPPKQNRSRRSGWQAGAQTSRQPSRQEPIIPKEYAEDVDFVEVKVFQETDIRIEKKPGYTEYHESQVTDVEWEEVKRGQ